MTLQTPNELLYEVLLYEVQFPRVFCNESNVKHLGNSKRSKYFRTRNDRYLCERIKLSLTIVESAEHNWLSLRLKRTQKVIFKKGTILGASRRPNSQ